MRTPTPDPRQQALFIDVIESVETADVPFVDTDSSRGTRVARPKGRGWRVVDYSHDKSTSWSRRRPVVVPQPSMVGGRWRRR